MNDYSYEQAAHLTTKGRPPDGGVFDMLDVLAQLHAEYPVESIAPLLERHFTGDALELAVRTVAFLQW